MPPKKKKEDDADDKKERIAIVETQKCKPKKCRQECKRNCPVVRMGKECIVVDEKSKVAFLSEELCIGCGICVKKCPFEAIQIINLPKNLEKSTMHRYGANTFKLHRLPSPRAGQVLGLVGTNGIGKSTALKILAGKQKPNLGRFDNPPEWAEILAYFRGSELQNYFTRILVSALKRLAASLFARVKTKNFPQCCVFSFIHPISMTAVTLMCVLAHMCSRSVFRRTT
jgi:ATP-binding cassette subfamily E protein 1